MLLSRFVCGTLLGDRGGAGYLAAVSPEGVVYGSGESLVVLSRVSSEILSQAPTPFLFLPPQDSFRRVMETLRRASYMRITLSQGNHNGFTNGDAILSFAHKRVLQNSRQ